MSKQMYAEFDQKSLTSHDSKGDVGSGVCLGTCIEYVKYFKKYGTSDSLAMGFIEQGSGLTGSLLSVGAKGIATHYSEDAGDLFTLWGFKPKLEELGFKVTVGKDTGANKDKVVAEIKSSNRLASHILYFDVYKDALSKADWHVVALKGNGWMGISFDRIFYAIDPNQGLWKITSTASLGDWLWSDINAKYVPFNMHVITIV